MARSKQLKRLEPWHHRLIDEMLACPGRSGREYAALFGVSPVWISIVKNSSVFQTELERRREKLSKSVADEIVERAALVAELSLDVLKERIEQNGDDVTMKELTNTVAMTLKMLGYPRTKARGDTSVTVSVDADDLVAARARLRQHPSGRIRLISDPWYGLSRPRSRARTSWRWPPTCGSSGRAGP
jgi:hypothetical protein